MSKYTLFYNVYCVNGSIITIKYKIKIIYISFWTFSHRLSDTHSQNINLQWLFFLISAQQLIYSKGIVIMPARDRIHLRFLNKYESNGNIIIPNITLYCKFE